MKNINKMFGAVAIIGLFLICSMSTGLGGATGKEQTLGAIPGVQIEGEPAYADFDDEQYPIGYPGESLDYPNTLPFTHNGDLATTIAWRRPTVLTQARIRVRVRNVGPDQSGGGTVELTVYPTFLGIPQLGQPVYESDRRTVSPLDSGSSEVHIFPSLIDGIDMSGALYYFRSNIDPYQWEGLVRHHSVRWGFLIGIII